MGYDDAIKGKRGELTMQNNQNSEEKTRSLFFNLTVVAVFVAVMLGLIAHFYQNAPNLKRASLQLLADSFRDSVNKAHLLWQAEEQPEIILLSTFSPRLDDENALVETDKHPVFMGPSGWPNAELSGKGCEEIWNMVLNSPLEIEGFRVIAEFYDGEKWFNDVFESRCRFRLSVGPYFEYKVHTGEVLTVEG